jgi:hypothetical protein
MTPAELRRFARLGAEARLQELEQERAAIFGAFPSLTKVASAPIRGVTSDGDGSAEPTPRRRRRKMSREARQRIADAQRKRWAEWKANKGNGGQRVGDRGRSGPGPQGDKSL